MTFEWLTGSEIFTWLILPLLIMAARALDVTIGTIRIIFVARGMRAIAAVCGFFEILIWLIAITQIFQNLSNFIMYVAYAAGFALGTYIGVTIENKLAMGYVALRIITHQDARKLMERIQDKDITVANIGAQGVQGRVRLIFSVIKRKDLEEVIGMIKKYNPAAYYSIEDIRRIGNSLPVFDKPKHAPFSRKKQNIKVK